MIIASLISAGLSAATLERRLKAALKTGGWTLKTAAVTRYHYPAILLTVKGDKQFDSPFEILRILKRSSLPAWSRSKAVAVIETLIEAESKVHGVPRGHVHFHELNSIDTLIDAAGACLAVELLGIDTVLSSPLNTGRPAPASLEIIKKFAVPVYSDNHRFELSTPTGTAIIANISEGFGPMPEMTVKSAGFSAGTQVIEGKQNILQSFIGESRGTAAIPGSDEVILLETNIDDMDPRVYPYVTELLLKAGAKDAWLTQIIMKKGRPGITLSVLCAPEKEGELSSLIFRETTTLGIRRLPVQRRTLPRLTRGMIKSAMLAGKEKKSSIEFEAAKKLALRTGKPLKDIL